MERIFDRRQRVVNVAGHDKYRGMTELLECGLIIKKMTQSSYNHMARRGTDHHGDSKQTHSHKYTSPSSKVYFALLK